MDTNTENNNIENNSAGNSNNNSVNTPIQTNTNPNVITIKTIVPEPKSVVVNTATTSINSDLVTPSPNNNDNNGNKKNKGKDFLMYIIMIIIVIVMLFLLIKYCDRIKNDGKGMIPTSTTQNNITTTKNKSELSTNTTSTTTVIPISTVTTSTTSTKKISLISTTKTKPKTTKKTTSRTTTTTKKITSSTTTSTTTTSTTTKKVDRYTYKYTATWGTGNYELTVYLNGKQLNSLAALIGSDGQSFSSSKNGQFTITGGTTGAKDISSCKNIKLWFRINGEDTYYTVYPESGCPNF